jgi:CRISPR-associated endonuclease/helicase Cas3
MNELGADRFPDFFEAVHGQRPFPWQTRLARQVVETGRWPSLLDLPTGAGKTAAIDVAVFHLSCQAERGPARTAPLRVLFVIDRRIVVDAAFERAKRIAEALRTPEDEVVAKVAQRLSFLSGDPEHPLDVVRLRGGVPQERDWARSPAQPLIAVSTVDQVGSRLLFRGYGVSSKMSPVHAGLVGADALWLLDEVHLSQPLVQTLHAIAAGHSAKGYLAERQRLAPFAMVQLSATPSEKPAGAFGLDTMDHAHSVLKPRLAARKITEVEAIDGDAADAFAAHAQRLWAPVRDSRSTKKAKSAKKAKTLAEALPVQRLAVVVNRVDLARNVFQKLKKQVGERADVLLLTGRVRPLDRDRLLTRKAFSFLFAKARSQEPQKPIILVATQTIEAGADLDVDALVTEIAPLDCLRQRFGRLDRLGTRRESRAVILAPKGREGWKPLERIYGNAPRETKTWLDKLVGEVDFGIDALQAALDAAAAENDISSLLAPRERAPVLLPAYADLWATTSPAPSATPEPALFLHGPDVATDVAVVWRADVDPSDEGRADISLELCPPSALEALPVPFWAVRNWLQQSDREAPVADVPEKTPETEPQARKLPAGRPALRQDDEGQWISVLADRIRPGDLIAVPAEGNFGGCDEFGWNADSINSVTDLGAEAHYHQRRKGALRVTLSTLTNALRGWSNSHGTNIAAAVWPQIATVIADADDDVDGEVIRASLAAIDGLPDIWQRLLAGMKGRGPSVQFYDDDNRAAGFILYASRRLARGLLDESDESADGGADAVTDRYDSWGTGVDVKLSDHLANVEARALRFAKAAGLTDHLTRLVALAARLHDIGKVDPRFQADLRGANELLWRDPALASLMQSNWAPLAKSKRIDFYRGKRATPEGFRHEALSVALAAKHPEVIRLEEGDRDLLLWLIGTHHGHGRPFFPPCFDPQPSTTSELRFDNMILDVRADEAPLRLDQGWFERAARLRRLYGPWELARLEAILRLADHAASADEQDEIGRAVKAAATEEHVA